MIETTNVTTNSRHYDGFDLFNALENISNDLAPLRLLTVEIIDDTERKEPPCEDLQSILLYDWRQKKHSVYTRAQLLLDIIIRIEERLSELGIEPE